MTYLVSIAIGPVQEFIASARRSRDLWFGSWLLSELSKAAANAIVEQSGKLIFPSAPKNDLDPGSTFSVVNKIVAEIEVSTNEELRTLLSETVYCSMQIRLRFLRNEALAEAKSHQINGKLALNWVRAKAQIYDLIEYYWAAEPFNDPAKYAPTRQRVEALLTARKSTRNFQSSSAWSDYLPKSSLDGLRESVIAEAAYPQQRKDSAETKKKKARQLKRFFDAREAERLCGVSLLKRLGQRGMLDSFYSTSHVAALPLLAQLAAKENDKAKVRASAEQYVNALAELMEIAGNEIKKELGHVRQEATLKPNEYFRNQDDDDLIFYDGRLLFEDRLREFWPDEQDKAKRNQAKQKLKEFFNDVFDNKESIRPLPYYAILHADGDHMGTVIEQLAEQGIEKHRVLSGALSKFAGLVKSVLEINHDGSCIYAGGDDVLAFVPLHRALDSARALTVLFKSCMEESGLFADDKIKPPTLSVGLAVGHHLDPLQDTLELARNAEKIAKTEVDGKNALAVTISKRSGIDRTAKGSWDGDGSLYQRLNYFIYLHLSDELPDSAAYDLQDVSLRLKPPALPADATAEQKAEREMQKETLAKAQKAEAKRILKRKQPKHGKQKVLADDVYEQLQKLIEAQNLALNQVAEELIIARIFAQAIEQSGIGKDEATGWAEQHGIKLLPVEHPESSVEQSTHNNQERETK